MHIHAKHLDFFAFDSFELVAHFIAPNYTHFKKNAHNYTKLMSLFIMS